MAEILSVYYLTREVLQVRQTFGVETCTIKYIGSKYEKLHVIRSAKLRVSKLRALKVRKNRFFETFELPFQDVSD